MTNIIAKLRSNRTGRQSMLLTGVNVLQLSSNLRRVTLSGDGLNDFPPNSVGGYVKLVCNEQNGAKPLMGTYAVLQQ
ncbi:MAG: siderophore-interacting protein [Acidiferrobacterales bacterium]|nr:siderophore-interacting protein [Acidiferrobacterales bacterium]